MAFRALLVLLVLALASMAAVVHSTKPGNEAIHFGMKFTVNGHGVPSMDWDEDELLMGLVSARRQLGDAGYISYEALKQDRVPCNDPGISYYDCRAHERANPYTRGCTKATRCARNNR